MSTRQHKADAPASIRVGILTVSTTRTPASDRSGQWIRTRAEKEGHRVVCHRLVTDEAEIIRQAVREIVQTLRPHLLILTGGTGIGRHDVTIETVRPMMRKELTAFSSVFSQLSFEQIDSAAIMSRATAGVVEETAVFCLPGSLNACKLACDELIFPEAGHLARHLNEN